DCHRNLKPLVFTQFQPVVDSLGKARQQSLFPGQRHVLALTAADRFRLQRLDPAAVIGHVGAVHGAQRNTHRLRDRGLGHSALAQQYHLNALPLSLGHFPMQRCLQLPNWRFVHLTIRPLRSRWPDGITKFRSPAAPNYRKLPDSISSGSGMTDDDLNVIGGHRDQLEGKIQERYGIAKDQARRDIDDWYSGQRW